MRPLTPDDLLSLEAYDRVRPEFRRRAIDHQKRRRVALGPDVTVAFEDRLTVQYQIQEMLRIERIFEREGVLAELEAYNPLVPDGTGLTATMMIELPDPEIRRVRLRELRGIEDRICLRVGDAPARTARADENLPRTTDEKTASVHYLRFPLTPEDRRGFAASRVVLACDHPLYRHETVLDEETRGLLARDWLDESSG